MKKRSLLLPAACLNCAAAAAVVVSLLWRGTEDGSERKTPQSRAFAAAAGAPVSDGAANSGTPAKQESAAPAPGLTAEQAAQVAQWEAEGRQEARRQFLLLAKREPGPVRERIHVLGRLKGAFDADYNVRTAAAALNPENEEVALARERSRCRADRAEKKLDSAAADLKSLAPEAKREWDEQEAAGWQEFSSPPVHVLLEEALDDSAAAKWTNFEMKRKSVERPLVEAYAESEDRMEDLMAEWRKAGKDEKLTLEVMQARIELGVVHEHLDAVVLESVQLDERWSAKNWEGYEMQEMKNED